jgi:hypothetical protein
MIDLSRFSNQHGNWVFIAGKEAADEARTQALQCRYFAEDDEDEQVDDVPRSCYNCAYRRWTSTSFQCLAINSVITNEKSELLVGKN